MLPEPPWQPIGRLLRRLSDAYSSTLPAHIHRACRRGPTAVVVWSYDLRERRAHPLQVFSERSSARPLVWKGTHSECEIADSAHGIVEPHTIAADLTTCRRLVNLKGRIQHVFAIHIK